LGDDSSVRKAWQADDARYRTFERDFRRAIGRFVVRKFRRPAPVLRVLRRGRRLVDRTTEHVRAEEPTTASGTSAKEYVLLSLGNRDRYHALMERVVRLISRGRVRAYSVGTEAARMRKRARRNARTARRLFRQARDEPPLSPAPASPNRRW
jgi:hypothetical protein